jgi:hypothetical protein
MHDGGGGEDEQGGGGGARDEGLEAFEAG